MWIYVFLAQTFLAFGGRILDLRHFCFFKCSNLHRHGILSKNKIIIRHRISHSMIWRKNENVPKWSCVLLAPNHRYYSDIPDGGNWKNQSTRPHGWRWPSKKKTPTPTNFTHRDRLVRMGRRVTCDKSDRNQCKESKICPRSPFLGSLPCITQNIPRTTKFGPFR